MSEILDPVGLRPLLVDEDQSQRISGPDHTRFCLPTTSALPMQPWLKNQSA